MNTTSLCSSVDGRYNHVSVDPNNNHKARVSTDLVFVLANLD
jgi:hypothetical protein